MGYPYFGNTHMFSGFSFFRVRRHTQNDALRLTGQVATGRKGLIFWWLWKSGCVRTWRSSTSLAFTTRLEMCFKHLWRLGFQWWRQIPLQISRLSFFLICLSTHLGRAWWKTCCGGGNLYERRWSWSEEIIAKEKHRYLQGDYHSDWQHQWGINIINNDVYEKGKAKIATFTTFIAQDPVRWNFISGPT